MTRMTKLASFCLLSLVLGVPAVADAAGATTSYRLNEDQVGAYGGVTDGCSNHYAQVIGAESIIKESAGGPPSSFEGVFTYGYGFDCNTELSYYFYGSGPADQLEIANNLSSANMEATITVQYCTFGPPDFVWSCADAIVSAELTAQAIAPPRKENRREHTTLPDGTQFHEHFKGTTREALVSGNVTLPSQVVVPMQSGGIGEISIASITINPP